MKWHKHTFPGHQHSAGLINVSNFSPTTSIDYIHATTSIGQLVRPFEAMGQTGQTQTIIRLIVLIFISNKACAHVLGRLTKCLRKSSDS